MDRNYKNAVLMVEKVNIKQIIIEYIYKVDERKGRVL